MESLLARLAEARRNGEVLRIAYHGGSQPGSAREISPMSISGDDLIAHDLATDEVRTFKLAKIEVINDGVQVVEYDATRPPPAEDTTSLGETFAGAHQELERLGWHVQILPDSLSLHGFFKNGKPRKTPIIGINYSESVVDIFDDFDGRGLQEVRHPSKRPYYVYSPGFEQARTFAVKSKAVELFWEEARRLAPNM